MRQKPILWPFFIALFFAAVAYAMAPRWLDQVSLWAHDDPVEIAQRAVDARLSPAVAERYVPRVEGRAPGSPATQNASITS